MLPNNPRCSFAGEPDADFINEVVLHDAICAFLKKRLPEWASDSRYHHPKIAEDDLTDWLSNFLNTCAEQDLPTIAFTNQQRQPGGRSTDLGIRPRPLTGIRIGTRSIHRDDPISTIEAKRLPTPDSRRRREYVIGDRIKKGRRSHSGGIERYKESEHAKGTSHAYMLAYIQAHSDTGDWLTTVNTWISEVAQAPPNDTTVSWSEKDRLNHNSRSRKKRLSTLDSQHSRTDTTTIKLSHFWLDLIGR